MYLLCKTLCENGVADATGSDLFVVFISNEKKQASMFLLFVNNNHMFIVVSSYVWSCFVLALHLHQTVSRLLIADLGV